MSAHLTALLSNPWVYFFLGMGTMYLLVGAAILTAAWWPSTFQAGISDMSEIPEMMRQAFIVIFIWPWPVFCILRDQ